MKRKLGPDKVCATAAETVKLRIAALPGDPTCVLIEGDKAAFKFLARLFSAHAEGECCGFHIHPKSAGKIWFKKGSKLGLYLHRLPCDDRPLHR